MKIVKNDIDAGKPFDWGRASTDYAKYRDIYPQEFYENILQLGIGLPGQNILDIGTGTGVLPRNMYSHGANWVGTDLSENQIAQAKMLSEGMNIDYQAIAAEDLQYPDSSFDAITACQCFFYFDHERLMPKLQRMLKTDGSLLVLYMAWLPFEDKIAGASEELVLKYNPKWSGAGEIMHPIAIPECYQEHFTLDYHTEYRIPVEFTRETWNGRIKACRGIGASLSEEEIAQWEEEHLKMLKQIAPESFTILHYIAICRCRAVQFTK